MGALPSHAFLERTREFAALDSSLRAARENRGTVCLISGEPGIGKSRLLAEFTAKCQQLGVPVHWGSAWEAGGAPVYWPWIQVLRSVLAGPEGRASLRYQPHLAPAIAELVPEIGAEASGRPVNLEPEQARFRLMDAIASILQALSAAKPLVVVFEDMHSADPDSLVLFEFVARQLRNSQALLLGSYRATELHRPRVGNVLTRIMREAVQLQLEGLGRDSVREYIRAATGERPLEQTVTEIFRLTEGHPLYLKEVMELGLSSDGSHPVPTTLATAIEERVAQFPPETQSLLGAASVLGRDLTVDALAELTEESIEHVEQHLAPAIAARLIEHVSTGALRFEHMLVREALHVALPSRRRRALHESRVQRLLEQNTGENRPWPELARHLEESGPDQGLRVVEAWSRAAEQADARHALDDAALCASRALEAAAESKDATPNLRAHLLRGLASAQIRAGDLEAGRRNSMEAFSLAESVRDVELMADAALTYGGIFTYGNVDRRLVEMLRKSLAALSDHASSRRARVLARLAAAMQPAEVPGEPIQMARESIRIARATGDRHTLFGTLRSAISALMDLGDPHERMKLNREYVALAESLHDTSECMLGHMRLVIDAAELGDAATMDNAIDQCGAIAQALGLPQYQWNAAAFRVMQATMRGNLNVATSTLEQAEQLAQRSQDPNAARTLAVQRMALAELRGSKDELRLLARELENSFAGLPMADTYLKPYLLTVLMRCGEQPPGSAADADHVHKIIQFRDLAAICGLGEFLAAHGDRGLAAEVYENLLPHRQLCGHWGLLGMRWAGPVARVLGLIATVLGKADEANAHFATALDIARRMNAKPWIDRITSEWKAAGIEAVTPAASAALPGIPALEYFRLARDGALWACECEGKRFHLRDSRGMQMLARLIGEPRREIHVLDLAGASGADAVVDAGDSGELLDDRARRDYRKRMAELQTEVEEAEAQGDAAAAEEARAELEQLSGELARAFGLDGRARRAGSAVERARINVQRRLKDAQSRIGKECPAAGRHLEWAIRTGLFCSYRPG